MLQKDIARRCNDIQHLSLSARRAKIPLSVLRPARIPYDPRDSLSFAVHSLINPTSVYLCFPVGPWKRRLRINANAWNRGYKSTIYHVDCYRRGVSRIFAGPVAGARSMNPNVSFPFLSPNVHRSCFFGYVSRLSVHVIDTAIYARKRAYDFLRNGRATLSDRSVFIGRTA